MGNRPSNSFRVKQLNNSGQNRLRLQTNPSAISSQSKKTMTSAKNQPFQKTRYTTVQALDQKELEELYLKIENTILDRVAENYIDFMIGSDGKDKDLFFQVINSLIVLIQGLLRHRCLGCILQLFLRLP